MRKSTAIAGTELLKRQLLPFKKYLTRNSVVLKLFGTYFILTMLLSAAIILTFYSASHKLVRQRISESFSLLLEYVCADVNMEYEQLLHLSDYIFVNQDIKTVLEMGDNVSLEKRQLNKQVREAISEYTNANYLTDINHIIISDLERKYTLSFYMNYTDALSSAFNEHFSEYIRTAQKASGMLMYSGLVRRNLFPDSPNGIEQNEIIFCRSIKDFKYMSDIGIMYFAINPQLFFNRMQYYRGDNQELASQANFLLLDNLGNVVSQNDNLYTADELEQILASGDAASSQGLTLQKEQQIVFTREIFQGWSIIGSIPISFVAANTSAFIPLYMITVILCVIICMMVGFLISRSIFHPIHQIGLKMQRIAAGEKYLRINTKSEDEIGQLATHLNQMLDQIDTLNNENLQKELQMRDAMHRAKQSQINPHFIRNTLNGIRWMAIMLNEECIKNAVDALWRIIKYNTSTPKNYFVRVQEEIDILRQYISLQQLSYVDKFMVEWDIDEKLLDCKCLKFFLQPIIENSILHGACSKGGTITIYISCYKENSSLVFNIYDTGIGMPPDILEGLFRNSSGITDHIGLMNVRERLQYAYGGDFSFDITSEVGRYTNVMIKTPLLPFTDLDPTAKGEDIQCLKS